MINSFALLQDEVEDDGAAVSDVNTSDVPNGAPKTNGDVSKPEGAKADADAPESENKDSTTDAPEAARKEKDLTLEEYFQQKAALSSDLTSLNSQKARRANDGKDFGKMSVLKKADSPEVMDGVAVKTSHEVKALKDSTHAAVARNAEIQKFFQRDPNERRPYAGRGRGRGAGHYNSGDDYRGSRGRGSSGSGRGGYDRGSGEGRYERPRGDRFDRDRNGGGFRGGYRSSYRGGARSGSDDRPAENRTPENGEVISSGPPRGDGNTDGEEGNKTRFRTAQNDQRGGEDRFERSGSGERFERADRGGDRFEKGDRGGDRFEKGDRGDRYEGGRGGRGRFDRGRGRGRGRGGYHGDGHRGPHDRKYTPKSAVVAPNVDDTVAFPSL